jgi:hypothetical protein
VLYQLSYSREKLPDRTAISEATAEGGNTHSASVAASFRALQQTRRPALIAYAMEARGIEPLTS